MIINIPRQYRFSNYSLPSSSSDFSIYYCLVDSENNLISNIASCKDYMGDVLFQAATKNTSTVSLGTNRIDFLGTENLKVVFLFPNATRKGIFLSNIKIIHNIEKKAGLKLSKFTPCSFIEYPNAHAVLVEADKFWKASTLVCSTYFQIVRTLRLIKTNRRVLNTFIKEVLSTGLTDRDVQYWNSINDSKIDIQFLINNIDEILGEDRLTGVCDERIIRDNGNGCTLSVTLGSDKLEMGTVGASHNHGSHGIKNFAYNVSVLIQTRHIVTAFGIKWAYNYLKLKGEIDE